MIDGQQRLRAIMEFLDGRVRLTQSKQSGYRNKSFDNLDHAVQRRVLEYGLTVEVLRGYSDADIRDMFVRINRFVVALSPQELRNARESGAFADHAEQIGAWEFWATQRVFSARQLSRMRAVEFAAELTILLIEGPQDKKKAIDLYYGEFASSFPGQHNLEVRLSAYLNWLAEAVPDLRQSRFRRPVDLYGVVGALARLAPTTKDLRTIHPARGGELLRAFELETQAEDPTRPAGRYLTAASRQTDNIQPRTTRIMVLEAVLRGSSTASGRTES